MATDLGTTKSSWADEIDDERESGVEVMTDENGVKTIVKIKENAAGKKVKITTKMRYSLVTETVNKVVAERMKWQKFGEERGHKPGPDPATTTIGEEILLKLGSPSEVEESAEDVEQKAQGAFKTKNITCRICKSDHFTSKCPYKDTMPPLDELTKLGSPKTEEPVGPGKYMPPALRRDGAALAAGESPTDRDSSCTLRVTNLSVDTREPDIYELFHSFGNITRVFLARDRETNTCKGFAFVSFSDRGEAERARDRVDGRGYDNLILSVEFARNKT